ncbi:hypothetical protein ACOMHN_049278 [Nucella lapillus]
MVIVKRTSLKFVLCTRTYHSADCDTDHSLVCSKIRLLPKTIHHKKQFGKLRINTTKMQYPETVEEFAKSLEGALSADHPHSSETTPVIEAKRAALAEYKRSPSEKSLQAHGAARSKVHQTARRCSKENWQQLSDDI